MQLTAGQLLQGGKYIINHPLETAGFGITYLGTQTESGQSVVLKTLHPALFKSRAFGRLRDRFVHLSSELTRCHHPSLVHVIELFQEGDWPFMVMEYIHGQSFAELIQAGRPLAEMEALHYIRSIAAGLQISHRQGLVHGNLKPENLIRRAGSNVGVIVGYGISAERMLAGVQYAVPGFPHAFTAPEQIGATGDRLKSADLYGLAAQLYYLLTGQPPMVSDRPEVIAATERASRAPQAQLPQLKLIKPSLQQVIRQGLALNPQDRPASIEAWLQLLPDPTAAAAKLAAAKPAAAKPITAVATAAPKPQPTQIPPPKTTIQAPLPPTVIESSPAMTHDRSETIASPPVNRAEPIARPRFQPTPERPAYRQTPIGAPRESAAPPVAAGMSIAPPTANHRAEQQLQQRPSRPYAALPETPMGNLRRTFNLKRWLIMVSGLAAIGGFALGMVVKFSAPRSATGSSVFNADQGFPNRTWEGTLTPDNAGDSPIEESTSGIPARPGNKATPEKATLEPEPTNAFDAAPILESAPAEPLNSGRSETFVPPSLPEPIVPKTRSTDRPPSIPDRPKVAPQSKPDRAPKALDNPPDPTPPSDREATPTPTPP